MHTYSGSIVITSIVENLDQQKIYSGKTLLLAQGSDKKQSSILCFITVFKFSTDNAFLYFLHPDRLLLPFCPW